MIDLGLRDESGPVTLAAISERQGISLSYLEQLFGKLRRHHIVDSVRGPGGGYTMAAALDAVTVADVIAAVDEEVDATMCGGKEDCHNSEGPQRVGGGNLAGAAQHSGGKCMTHDLWATLNQKVHDYLDSVTLADLVKQARDREAGVTVIAAETLATRRPSFNTAAAR